MKFSFLIICSAILAGCTLGTPRELKKAEVILNQFECKNIETGQLNHSAITSYHERTLSVSKEKASSYVESYKEGEEIFRIPLDQVVQQQYDIYKSACENASGRRMLMSERDWRKGLRFVVLVSRLVKPGRTPLLVL